MGGRQLQGCRRGYHVLYSTRQFWLSALRPRHTQTGNLIAPAKITVLSGSFPLHVNDQVQSDTCQLHWPCWLFLLGEGSEPFLWFGLHVRKLLSFDQLLTVLPSMGHGKGWHSRKGGSAWGCAHKTEGGLEPKVLLRLKYWFFTQGTGRAVLLGTAHARKSHIVVAKCVNLQRLMM